MTTQPSLHTSLSPALLHLYDLSDSIVVIIDVLRATSTIATALYNGASSVIPVDSVAECIALGNQLGAITAGERDGKVAEGLTYGNSPFEYPRNFIANKTLVLTTTNGTKLLHMALNNGAPAIITGSFPNLTAVADFVVAQKRNVVLGCAAWKDRFNLEDTLFAGAVISRIKSHFHINCDSSQMAESLYLEAKPDLFNFMKEKNASHYLRLSGYGLEKDISYCLTADSANVLPVYKNGRLIVQE
ncbi:2-phosphosulfolactate phosphatase [Flavihumibacter fluvii]|uniref:2-phosphosulfolactate phosphatase n=1 Tax=Flavihumibacter fluvii TaxID=2838157 RepID=UPI001BDDF5BF|nr:2-phosphosulfolactate phosphatase [Flavihumibacter fluvii]ULQ51818.1 2-phosphosulfolactate phosphatase [Flavihumibacter fluvii]